MSDATSTPARPVSLITTLCVLALFSAFFFVVRHYYRPVEAPPFVTAPENLPKELEWKATRESRRQALADLRQQQADQARAYAWIDQQAGIVQLPIERAMELTVQQYGAKK
jgi:hypothetical protein